MRMIQIALAEIAATLAEILVAVIPAAETVNPIKTAWLMRILKSLMMKRNKITRINAQNYPQHKKRRSIIERRFFYTSQL